MLLFGLNYLLRDGFNGGQESELRVRARIRRKQRHNLDLGVSGNEQRSLVGEVPVCRGARDLSLGSRLLHGRRGHPACHQGAGGGDQLVAGTPLHLHPEADETFYMLEGEILLHFDGHERRLGAGGIAFLPRGVPHAYVVTSAKARMLCFQNPGSGEAFYLDASEPLSQTAPGGVVDFGRVQAAAARTGAIEILGPPPFSQP